MASLGPLIRVRFRRRDAQSQMAALPPIRQDSFGKCQGWQAVHPGLSPFELARELQQLRFAPEFGDKLHAYR